jgi:CRP/FNR family transcriptional regulator, cyclic AMP receptor protein
LISTQFLRDSPLFRDLDETERAQVLIIGQVRSFQAEEVIFREGDAGDGLYIVIDGAVRISKQTAAGEEALTILEPNAFFGEMALVDFSTRAADAIANTATETFFIPLKELRSLIEVNHGIALKVLYALCEVLTQRLRETNDRYMTVFTLAQWGGGMPAGNLFPIP